MERFLLVLFFGLLISAYGVSGNIVHDNFNMLEDLETFEIEKDYVELSEIPSLKSGHCTEAIVNVDSFGAVGDGVSDDTQAFRKAWEAVCSTPYSVLLVPEGRRYLVNATRFQGPCADKLIVQIDGTIVAPDEPSKWDPNMPRLWLVFSHLKGAKFQGSGTIDGSGSKWWAASCKKNKTNPCRGAPTAMTMHSSSAIIVKGITFLNSQQMHFVISQSTSVLVSDVQVSAPGDSPNTDGIHITGSKNVIIQDCKIGTGDDCVSIVNASSRIKMKDINCGPGHGISIGSLGKDNSIGIVTAVVLDRAFLRETTNGLRIKTWQGGSGYVRGVLYKNVRMENVKNPIIIDQFYCDSPKLCKNQTSAVEISEIIYDNIVGTSNSKKAISFACADKVPCKNIVLYNINLKGTHGEVETFCNSVEGFSYGKVHPLADCLTPSSCKDETFINHRYPSKEHIVHTEL